MNREDQNACLELRKEIFLTGYRGGMAHLASCYSCLEILYTLYLKGVLRYDAQNAKWEGRDRLVLSKGHAGLALYAVLARAGLMPREDFESYLMPCGRIGGESCTRDSEWIEATTGSLGHGLPMAVGMAVAQKMDGGGARSYVLLGDGECQEGSVWEGAMAASSLGLDNLVAILDWNGLQKTNRVEETLGTVNWREKWESFGWEVGEVDGHDTDALRGCLSREGASGRPRMVLAHTIKGKGVSLMENQPAWHFKLPSRREMRIFQEELGIADEELV